MFTVLRVETLDTWDEVLHINLYGCAKSARGYPYLQEDSHSQCDANTIGGGWGTVLALVIIVVGTRENRTM